MYRELWVSTIYELIRLLGRKKVFLYASLREGYQNLARLIYTGCRSDNETENILGHICPLLTYLCVT